MDELTKLPKKKVKDKRSSNKASLVNGMFSGRVLVSDPVWKQRKYFALLFVLALAYISWSYYMELTVIKRQKLEYELRMKKMEYTEKKNEFTKKSKRSEVLKEIEKRNIPIVESETPPRRIGEQ